MLGPSGKPFQSVSEALPTRTVFAALYRLYKSGSSANKDGKFFDVHRNGMKNPASEVGISVALESRPSAVKLVYLLSLQ